MCKIESGEIIKCFSEDGNYIKIETVIEKEEIEVEDSIYENPTSSYIKLTMFDCMDEEIGSINLDNCNANYFARKLLEGIVFFD